MDACVKTVEGFRIIVLFYDLMLKGTHILYIPTTKATTI